MGRQLCLLPLDITLAAWDALDRDSQVTMRRKPGLVLSVGGHDSLSHRVTQPKPRPPQVPVGETVCVLSLPRSLEALLFMQPADA